ncbi:MAG: hypothetical protein RIR00_371 [Pseudomonadota bacterium]|jgi:drug/metabolite transporter (DMT)-like permease
MSVPVAYVAIVMIWSTTPLAVQWSTQGCGFALAVLLRMAIGFVLAASLVRLGRIGLPLHRRARRAYLLGGVTLFLAMALTYWGARFIHSGLISVLYGLSPLVAGVMASLWLGEKALTPGKLAGMGLGLAGLALIFLQSPELGGEQAMQGMAAMLLAVCVYSFGMVGLKRIGDDSPPLATTTGTLGVSLPLFALLWWFTDGSWPEQLPWRSAAAILYLGVFGSVLGFALYYYVIRHLETGKVALITLITPVIALWLGHVLNGETVTPRLLLGTTLILAGLSLHQGADWWRKRQAA